MKSNLAASVFSNSSGPRPRQRAALPPHPRKDKFKCPRCSKEYVFQSGLAKHMREKHGVSEEAEVENKNGSDFSVKDENDVTGKEENDDTVKDDDDGKVKDKNDDAMDKNDDDVEDDSDPDFVVNDDDAEHESDPDFVSGDDDEVENEDESLFFVDNHKTEDKYDSESFIDDDDAEDKDTEDEDGWGSSRHGYNEDGWGSSRHGYDEEGDRGMGMQRGEKRPRSKPQVEKADQRSLRSRRQHPPPVLPSRGASTASRNNAKKSPSPNQPPRESTKTVLTCKLQNPKTGKLCNKTFSSNTAQSARNNLQRHQKGAIHHPGKSKPFKCNQCNSRFLNPSTLGVHVRDVHGRRDAEFSDEESDSSTDEMPSLPPRSFIPSH